MDVLKVKLKQHTPLIHFQHNERGATLRASEVKPKLDRFIIEKIGGRVYEVVKQDVKNHNKELFIDKDGIYALNYKLQIKSIPSTDWQIRIQQKPNPKIKNGVKYYFQNEFPLILSNMGGKTSADELLNFSYFDTIELVFVTQGKQSQMLSSIIEKYIVLFFANQNFGQRSDKGFGSFTVSSVTSSSGTEHNYTWESEYLPENTTLFQYDLLDGMSRYDVLKELFSVIDFYWKSLKSGINYTKRRKVDNILSRSFNQNYKKAFLFQYLEKRGVTWEKRVVKNNLALESVRAKGDPEIKESNKPYFFARAHLGCPINGITYKVMKGDFYKNQKGNLVEQSDTVEVSVANNSKSNILSLIERIPSPIVFKPVFFQILREDKNTLKKVKVDVVAVYILFNDNLIDCLKNKPDTDFTFINEKNKKKVNIPLFINGKEGRVTIDFPKLIEDFHRFLKWKITPIDFRGEKILGTRDINMYVVKSPSVNRI